MQTGSSESLFCKLKNKKKRNLSNRVGIQAVILALKKMKMKQGSLLRVKLPNASTCTCTPGRREGHREYFFAFFCGEIATRQAFYTKQRGRHKNGKHLNFGAIFRAVIAIFFQHQWYGVLDLHVQFLKLLIFKIRQILSSLEVLEDG